MIYDSAARLEAAEAARHAYFTERPRPARLEEMTPPREKRAELGGGGGGADARADIPFHKHFEKLLNVVGQY